jgi:hypothetical protein
VSRNKNKTPLSGESYNDDPNSQKIFKLHGTIESELGIYGMASALSLEEYELEGRKPQPILPRTENKQYKLESKKMVK